ncbi:hypothetical protein DFJ73DRAFT_805071 [Zopfochytrium polystomum]|nr:hypothetical protein DFJ73DRAFT_805071 [Zopfochytrium polystomum]
MTGSTVASLRIFKALCGVEFCSNVVFVANMWHQVTVRDDEFFGMMIRRGSKSRRAPWNAQMGYEMVEKGPSVFDAAAVQTANKELNKVRKEYEVQIKAMKEEMHDAIRSKEFEMQELLRTEKEKMEAAALGRGRGLKSLVRTSLELLRTASSPLALGAEPARSPPLLSDVLKEAFQASLKFGNSSNRDSSSSITITIKGAGGDGGSGRDLSVNTSQDCTPPRDDVRKPRPPLRWRAGAPFLVAASAASLLLRQSGSDESQPGVLFEEQVRLGVPAVSRRSHRSSSLSGMNGKKQVKALSPPLPPFMTMMFAAAGQITLASWSFKNGICRRMD